MPNRSTNPGRAGPGARARAERTAPRRTAAAAAERGRLARLLRGVLGPSQLESRLVSEQRAWAAGPRGERLIAAHLANRCPEVPVLHDRRLPGGLANIDHLAFAASGVHVIDTRRYHGKVTIERPLLGSGRLLIAGRDRSSLIDGLHRQVTAVRQVLEELGENMPVHGCLCFVVPEGLLAESGLPRVRTLQLDGFPLYHPSRLCWRLNAGGPISSERATALRDALSGRLPPAVHPRSPS